MPHRYRVLKAGFVRIEECGHDNLSFPKLREAGRSGYPNSSNFSLEPAPGAPKK
jgi:hypothetical protein